jgi:tRNA A37 methylthiotransferase MiaB
VCCEILNLLSQVGTYRRVQAGDDDVLARMRRGYTAEDYRRLVERNLPDDVPAEEKMRRFRELEALQERIATEKNAAFLGQTIKVLVEGKHKGRWFGCTQTNRLVFFDDITRDLSARLVQLEITHTSAWSLQGSLASPSPVE